MELLRRSGSIFRFSGLDNGADSCYYNAYKYSR